MSPFENERGGWGVGVGGVGGMMVGGLDYFCGLADRQLVCFALEVLDRKQ